MRSQQRASRPTIIFIVADDLGFADLGCYGGRAPVSPTLDSLAAVAPSTVSQQQCLAMDWSATMLDAAGVSADASYPLDGLSLMSVLRDATHRFRRPLHWRMNHRSQRALRDHDWKYLKVDEHEYLFNIPADERERANQARQEPGRMTEMRQAWLDWNASMPPIPPDATVSLGFSVKDMPQR